MRFSTLLISTLLLFTSHCFAAVSVNNHQGQTLTLQAPASRVISLAPNTTELLFAIGAGASVVAVSTDSDYPLAAQKLPQVGGYETINIESILALHPDLVVVWQGGTSIAILSQLKRLHIPLWQINTPKLTDIATAMQQLGTLTGHSKTAHIAAQRYLKQLSSLQKHYGQSYTKLPVMIEYSEIPLYVATGNSIPSQVVALCGGQNVFESLPAPTQAINTEQVLAANPAIIIGVTPLSLSHWLSWPQLAAVQHQQLHVINASILVRDSPRILEGAAQICAWIEEVKSGAEERT